MGAYGTHATMGVCLGETSAQQLLPGRVMETHPVKSVTECDNRECGNRHTKFATCRDEAVYGMSLEFPDEETGDVSEYGEQWAMVTLDGDYVAIVDVDKYLDAGRAPFAVMVPAGIYIVRAAESGAVTVSHFEAADHQKARTEFDAHDAAYSVWLDATSGES